MPVVDWLLWALLMITWVAMMITGLHYTRRARNARAEARVYEAHQSHAQAVLMYARSAWLWHRASYCSAVALLPCLVAALVLWLP